MDAIATITDTYYGRQSGDVVVTSTDVFKRNGWLAAPRGYEYTVVTVLESNGSRAGTRYLLRSHTNPTAEPVEVTGMDLQEN